MATSGKGTSVVLTGINKEDLSCKPCSNLTRKTHMSSAIPLGEYLFKVNNNDTGTMPMTSALVSLLLTLVSSGASVSFLPHDGLCRSSIKFLTEIMVHSQKQPPGGVLQKSVLKNFSKFTGKYLRRSLFFNKVQACNFTKKSLRHRFLPVSFLKFLRTPFLKEYLGWLLLHFISLGYYSSIQGLIPLFVKIHFGL